MHMFGKTYDRLAFNEHLSKIQGASDSALLKNTFLWTPCVAPSHYLCNFSSTFQEHVADPSSYGIHVLDRKFVSVEESVTSLARIMLDFTQLSRRQRIIMRNRRGILSL